MPFGLCNAPAVYQRMMQDILGGLLWRECLVYLDDVLIFGRTFQEHAERLERVVKRLFDAGLLLKAKKCNFASTKTTFLGHVVSAGGLSPDPAKVDKIKNFPQPRTAKELRAFLGLGSYYRRYIEGFAQIAAPLYKLTEKIADFVWTPTENAAFDLIRSKISKECEQAHPDFNLPFIIDTDSSEIGTACVLSQKDKQGHEHPILMDSRKFTKAELKWHIREKEALGILYALDKFRPYIMGSQLLVRTDHHSLQWLMKAQTGRLCRWALRLQEYSPFQIQRRSGLRHSNVDAFTRIFAESECLPDYAFMSCISRFPQILPGRFHWINAQKSDSGCQTMIQRQKGTFRDGLFGIGKSNHWRPILPALIERTVKNWHQSVLGGHIGARKLMSTMSRYIIIPAATSTVKRIVESCAACKQRKPPARKHGLLASKPPSSPWKTVAMNFAGPYPTSNDGNRFVLVFTDHFTKWVELLPTPDQTAVTVTKLFYERIICRFGCPQQLLSDNGPQFRSSLVEHLCQYFGIEKIYSSAYYPQGDGFAERMMRTFNNCLASCARIDPDRWDHYLPGIALAYNSAEHEATRVSPFELNTGRLPRLPHSNNDIGPSGSNDQIKYPKRLRNVITECHDRARHTVQAYWSSIKNRYDRNRKDITLKKGDLVLVALTDQQRLKYKSRKLAPRWSRPVTVVGTLTNGVTFRVRHDDGHEEIVHGSRILPLKDPVWGDLFPEPEVEPRKTKKARAVVSPDQPEVEESDDSGDEWLIRLDWKPVTSAPAPTVVIEPAGEVQPGVASQTDGTSAEPETHTQEVQTTSQTSHNSQPTVTQDETPIPPGHYYIDRILGQRTREGRRELLISWWGHEDQTWEPRSHMEEDVPNLVAEFDNTTQRFRTQRRGSGRLRRFRRGRTR